MIKVLTKTVKNILAKTKGKLNLMFSKKVYVSYGENCLTDNILQRHLVKSFTTPFSHGRSNIEYILHLEKDDYKDFVNLEHLKYEELGGKNVARLKTYRHIRNDYNEQHKNGFEFTHHDVIKHEKMRLKMTKRVQLLRDLKGKKKFVMVYHHRLNPTTDSDLLLQDLKELKLLYSTPKVHSEVVCFTQSIVNDKKDRKVVHTTRDGVHCFVFHTENEWAGNDNHIFWANCDDDLIAEMIRFIKTL
jgi:hypothetical protein